MPQLDFHNVLTISQVVWMALIFCGLYLLFNNWALPQVGSVLEARATRIGHDLDGARIAKAQADDAVAHVQEATRRASTESQAAIAAAMSKAKAEAAEQAHAADAQLETQIEAAEQRIAAARAAAMQALRDVATETATAVVTRLTGREPEAAAVNGAVDRALAARG